MARKKEQWIQLIDVPAYLASIEVEAIVKHSYPDYQRLYRWSRVGLRGVRLEAKQIDGVLCTTPVALRKFFVATSGKPRTMAKATGA